MKSKLRKLTKEKYSEGICSVDISEHQLDASDLQAIWDYQQEKIEKLRVEYDKLDEMFNMADSLVRDGYAVHENSNSTLNMINKLDKFYNDCKDYFNVLRDKK